MADDQRRSDSPGRDADDEKVRKEVDRQKIPPFLIRMFFRRNMFHRMDAFLPPVSITTSEELQMYTWFNGTLKEILAVFATVVPEASGSRCTFRHVFQDPKNNVPSLMFKDIAVFMPTRGSKDESWTDTEGNPLDESSFTLYDFQFRIGDYLDVNITSPDAPPPPPTSSGQARSRDWSAVENKLDRRISGRGGRFGGNSGDRRWGP
ncbi:Sin3 associated polypeptide p18-domain-containing protein [Lipomyces chichibuensis]|uniref:Sin3 associated polypeptide p18-domain-containing protein n=1 Tax=Lipomyces chichibuensis TaxID=1546026 RepID=UPI00334330D5